MKAVVRILIVAFVLSFLLAGGEAQAQFKLQSPDEIKQFIDAAIAKKMAGIGNTIAPTGPAISAKNALQAFADFVNGDFSSAADLAITNPDLLDGNGQQCFDAMVSAGKVFQANPIPKDGETIGLANIVERLRLLAMTANKVCNLPSCTQVFADASGALATIAPIKTAVPNFHDLCSYVPNIAISKPTRTLTTPPPTPSPSPTP